MANIQVNPEELDESAGIMKRCFNETIKTTLEQLAAALANAGDLEVLQAFKGKCKAFQDQYNSMVESVNQYCDELTAAAQVYMIQKNAASNVDQTVKGSGDLGIKNKIDADAVAASAQAVR